jgi:predicted Zn-dependent protease
VSTTRRQFGCAVCAGVMLALAGRAGAQSMPGRDFLPPGYRPAPDTDESGLWGLMDREERRLRTSRFVIREPTANAYLRDIVCRLGKDYCPDVRIYVTRTPQFNASMAPNGMMDVWTGLLLRCVDEAQVAAILGHEMGHYLRRHPLERFRDARDKASVGAVLGLGLAVAGLGAAAPLASLALLASTYAYSRTQESEADEIGLELMAKAGYTPVAASEVWEQLIAEYAAGTAERNQQLLFATHPDPEDRLDAMRSGAAKLERPQSERGREHHLKSLAKIRGLMIHDELALRQYGRSELVFDRLLVRVPEDGGLWFAKGEVYRLRNGDGDPARALESYDKALHAQGAPAQTYRSIMLVELKRGAPDRAQAAFDAYLEHHPKAADAESLRMLLAK